MSTSAVNLSKTRPAVVGECLQGRGERVTYLSVNCETGGSFSASTSPNSQHAARLAQIAMAIQNNNNNNRRDREHRPKRLPLWLSSIRQWIHPQDRLAADSGERYAVVSGTGHPTAVNNNVGTVSRCTESTPSTASEASSATITTTAKDHCSFPITTTSTAWDAGHQPRVVDVTDTEADDVEAIRAQPVPVVRPVTTSQPLQVTRYRTEGKTAYEVQGQTGTVKISAPAGSSEAKSLDAVCHESSVPTLAKGDSHEIA